MQTLSRYLPPHRTPGQLLSALFGGVRVQGLLFLLLAVALTSLGCGSGSSSNNFVMAPVTLSGNWQFDMSEQINSDPAKASFTGGLQGGFLLQTNGSITGGAIFSIVTQPPAGSGATPTQCNSGTDQITGSISAQNVSLTATATNAQTFVLTGTLSLDGTTMAGTYTSTDGAGCGIATGQSQQQSWAWSARLVPPLTGAIQGVFQSSGADPQLDNQEFVVTGAITQGENFGAASATLTGNLSFVNPDTNVVDYPCLSSASVQGLISGNTVTLNIVGNGSTIGHIGTTQGSALSAVTFDSTQGGYVIESLGGGGYVLSPTSSCASGDSGNICLAINSTTACQQAITATPSALSFPAQAIGSPQTTQTITLTNTSRSSLSGVTFALSNTCPAGNTCDNNFAVTADNCGVNGAPSGGKLFELPAKTPCTVTIAYSPQQGCLTQPVSQCLTAQLVINSPNSPTVAVAITGGVTTGTASTHRLDSGLLSVLQPGPLRVFSPVTRSNPAQILPISNSPRSFQDVEYHAEID